MTLDPLRSSDDDERWMDRALELAAEGHGMTSPNPLVGAVAVRRGAIVGEGVHRRAGLPHAEPLALESAAAFARSALDSTGDLALYVNLEPCSHTGLTPPCVEAILRSAVRRVVAAMVDPNPLVSGRGIEALRAAGLRVEVGCRQRDAEELNHAFIARQRRHRPFVALKVALSADGCIAARGRERVQITGDPARDHAHRLRAGCDAILVGVETLRRDRPRLDRRLYHGPGRNPRRLVLDPQLRSEPEWLWPDGEPPVLFCAEASLAGGRERLRALEARAEVVPLPAGDPGLDLVVFATALERLGLWSVLVEGGGRTHRAFLEADLWDRLYVYRNPELRLDGLGWEAASVWERLRHNTVRRRTERLGGDALEVYDHAASVASTPASAGDA